MGNIKRTRIHKQTTFFKEDKNSMRKQLVKTMQRILREDPRLVLLLGDIGVYSFRDAFSEFPTRVFNIGILEQASISIAAGLAIENMIPVFHTIAPFMVERALEQLKIFGYQGLGGNFVSVGGSYDYSTLGCTHHCPGDVQILKTIPGTQIFVPGHPEEFDNHFQTNYANGKLNYYRLSEKSNQYPMPETMIRQGCSGRVIAIGPMLDRVLKACEGLNVTISYRSTVEPANFGDADVVVEPFYEGTMSNDVKSALHIGVPRQFLTSYGTVEEHDEKYSLTSAAIRERIRGFLNI